MEGLARMMKKTIAAAILTLSIITLESSVAGAGFPFSTAPPIGGGGTTTFQQCYVGCFVLCAIQPTQTLSSCGFECLRDCLIPQSTAATTATHSGNAALPTAFQFCNLGCASTHCTNISTLQNPRGKEVAGCVGSCSGMCRKNYKATP